VTAGEALDKVHEHVNVVLVVTHESGVGVVGTVAVEYEELADEYTEAPKALAVSICQA
jgi:hypothetical protein